MIKIEDQIPEPNQYITAKTKYPITYDKERGTWVHDENATSIVEGKALKNDPTMVIEDFYSGTGVSKIIEWEPRTPSFNKDCHPYTKIFNGIE